MVTEHKKIKRGDQRKARGLADLLLPAAMVAPGVMMQIDGSFLAAWRFSGPDVESADPAEMAELSMRLNKVLQLGGNWMIQCDAQRFRAPGYSAAGAFTDAVSATIDEERRQQFLAAGAMFESTRVITLSYLPDVGADEAAHGFMYGEDKSDKGAGGPASRALAKFQAEIAKFENAIGNWLKVERLGRVESTDALGFAVAHDELLAYWQGCLTCDVRKFAVGDDPILDLADTFACEDFVGGNNPKIGKKHLAVLSIDGYPKSGTPGILCSLDALSVPYRWNTRAILIDQQQGLSMLEKLRKKWRSATYSFLTQLFNAQATARASADAVDMTAETEAACALAESGDFQFCQFTSTIILADESESALASHVNEVTKLLIALGFNARHENLNAVEGFLGSLPGNGEANIRRVLIHTMNVADLLPTSSVYAGPRYCPNDLYPKQSPPLMLACTNGATPYRFHLHVNDSGHTIIVGPPGAGKSTLLAAIGVQSLRYPKSRVITFDRDLSMWAITQAVGGRHYDIGGEEHTETFAPLSCLDTAKEISDTARWVETLCEMNMQAPLTNQQKAEILATLRLMKRSTVRTLTEFVHNVQDMDIRAVLGPFTVAGQYGRLLDAERDSLSGVDERFTCFETKGLAALGPKVSAPLMLYLFRRIERMLDGSPTFLLIDEATSLLSDPVFVKEVEDWLRTMRKKNCCVVFATQYLSDIATSPIASILIQSCPTKIYLANASALTTGTEGRPGPYETYLQMGVNPRGIQLIYSMTPKRQYYVTSTDGRRVVDFGFGPVFLAFGGVNGAERRNALKAVMKKHQENWRSEWLIANGEPEWAHYLREEERRFARQNSRQEEESQYKERIRYAETI